MSQSYQYPDGPETELLDRFTLDHGRDVFRRDFTLPQGVLRGGRVGLAIVVRVGNLGAVSHRPNVG